MVERQLNRLVQAAELQAEAETNGARASSLAQQDNVNSRFKFLSISSIKRKFLFKRTSATPIVTDSRSC